MAPTSPAAFPLVHVASQRPTSGRRHHHHSPLISSSLASIKDSLTSCSNLGQFSPIHAHLITTNLILDHHLQDRVFGFLTSTRNLECAHQICSYLTRKDDTVWNTLFDSQTKGGRFEDVFSTYGYMVSLGVVLKVPSFKLLIRACSRCLALRMGGEVHGRIVKSGLGGSRSFLGNNLMGLYSRCGRVEEVRQLFERMAERDVVAWNTMMSCYVSAGMCREALGLFDEMVANGGVRPDEVTMISLVSACTKLRDLEMGQRLHLYAEENELQVSGSLLSCLVDMYIKCGELDQAEKVMGRYADPKGDVVLSTAMVSGYMKAGRIDEARQLFDQMEEKNFVSWTTMMSGYVQGGRYSESLELFRMMRFQNVSVDEVALVTALSACAHAEEYDLGRAIHGLIVTCGMASNGFLGNAMVDVYAKCRKLSEASLVFKHLPCKTVVSWNSLLDGICQRGNVSEARRFFASIPEKDIVSWNTMVNLFAKRGMFRESLVIFDEMQSSNVKPDKYTFLSLLSLCARIGALSRGIWIHALIEKNQIAVDCMLETALVDMYGKCGCVDLALKVFHEIAIKNAFVWTAMIAAYAMEGHAPEAINLFLEMEGEGIKPDHVTFTALLSACSHGGLINEGYKYLDKMRTAYNLVPKIQHYGCIVDLLGRSGCLEEAIKFIQSMPVKPDVSIWSSILGACRSQQDIESAEYAFKHLTEIDPTNDGAHMLLANLYANAGRMDDVSRVRLNLLEKGTRKHPGLSLIELDGVVHEFTSGDFSIPQSKKIYSMLEEFKETFSSHQQLDISSHHSERLAVTFALISNNGNSPIRIINTVKTCTDCHSFMKLISRAYGREIIIRDNYRFHRFRDGCCSCKDYW